MRVAAALILTACATLPACSSNRVTISAVNSCPARLADRPHDLGAGTVTRLLSQGEAMTLLSRTEALVGRPIDGAYLNNVRAVVSTGDGKSETILIPYAMTVAVGDRIAFQSGYLSPSPLCSYVPNLATRKF